MRSHYSNTNLHRRPTRHSNGFARLWIWLSILCSLSVGTEGIARGTRVMMEDDEEWLDLDSHSWIRKRGSPPSENMQMLLRGGQGLEEPEQINYAPIPAEDPTEPDESVQTKQSLETQSLEGQRQPVDNTQPLDSTSPTKVPSGSPSDSPTETPTAQPSTSPTRNARTCDADGGVPRYPFRGTDNVERLLLREGVIDEIPASRCGHTGKNVILVIGDGMGWEMARAGSIAKQVVAELKSLGCDIINGCPNNTAAIAAFEGRRLSDYYEGGKGSGLTFQNLSNYALVTTTAAVIQKPSLGNNSGSPYSMLEGSVSTHENGMAPLALNECGNPIEFNPTDHMTAGGNMVLWDDVKGGKYPWDPRYSQANPDRTDGFDPLFIIQHATDSSATATALATGQKVANTMQSVNLYEEEVSTIVEDAMRCGKAGGVVSSKPILHATPGTFISHSNNRKHFDQLRRSFREVNPTLASGTCARRFYPFPEDLESMRSGSLSRTWTFFEQKPSVKAENFYEGIEFLDPDEGDHVLVCLGGDFTPSKREELPYRGVDSSYSRRWCGKGTIVDHPNPNITQPIGVTSNSNLCDVYTQEEIKQIPHISKNVKAALDFLSKDDDGFFLMYEQGDIDTAAHSNHMDDLLGTLLDIDESVGVIMDWIANNGGWEKNALYVTSDHDHYLTLRPMFPERLAKLLIAGESHNITPENFSDQNPWDIAIQASRHQDANKNQVDHLKDFSTWTNEDIDNVGHWWGPAGSGGNGWASHSTRPVPIYYQGDDDCLSQFLGKGYQVLGRDVQGLPGKIDQVHIHACMMKNLFGYV